MSKNLLGNETSPYLLQHKDNPVHWRPWGSEAFDEARRSGRPILLSVGYAACHWCHVMAHESFENAKIAALMNDLFVNIKVDREERPDIDNLYQTALSLLGEQGGWPLTMFLNPDGKPFWGGTYFPPEPRYGRMAFSQVLNRISEVYHEESERVQQNAAALSAAVARHAGPEAAAGAGRPTLADLDTAADYALRLIDPVNGGTHGAPKFPQPALFRFLWRAYRRNRSEAHSGAVIRTLDALCQGGIYDHLGGGFARYSTDPVWLVPHFEKMLYDNAQLVDLLTEAWQITGSDLYAARIRETIEWVLRDMKVGDPAAGYAFASAYDADSEGVEGQYYVWALDEIARVLGPEEASFFNRTYDVSAAGNWEGMTILNRSQAPDLLDAEGEARLAASRAKLLTHRSYRIPPLRDDKVLADWNGLMIAALARAAGVFDEPAWLEAACIAFDFIRSNHGESGRFHHSWRAGTARHPAIIDDYANMSRAALTLFEATGETDYLRQAEIWVGIADTHYWDDTAGGYFLTADDTESLIARPKTIHDNAVPPGNGTMLEVLARLFHLTGRIAYRDRAEALAAAFAVSPADTYVQMPSLCMGLETLERPVQIVIAYAGDAGDLLRAARESAPPAHVLSVTTAESALPDGHPAQGKGPVDGRSAAYVCVGPTCGMPVTDPNLLREELARL